MVGSNRLNVGGKPEMSCETTDHWYVSRHLITEGSSEMTARNELKSKA